MRSDTLKPSADWWGLQIVSMDTVKEWRGMFEGRETEHQAVNGTK